MSTGTAVVQIPEKSFNGFLKACEELQEYQRLWNPLLARAKKAESELEKIKKEFSTQIAHLEGQLRAYEYCVNLQT